MKIKKVFRQNECNALTAFVDDVKCIKVNFFPHKCSIELDKSKIDYFDEDKETYHEVSTESFHRALRVTEHRINEVTSQLNFNK